MKAVVALRKLRNDPSTSLDPRIEKARKTRQEKKKRKQDQIDKMRQKRAKEFLCWVFQNEIL